MSEVDTHDWTFRPPTRQDRHSGQVSLTESSTSRTFARHRQDGCRRVDRGTAEGVQEIIDDSLFKRLPERDVLGHHVMIGPSGIVAGRAGSITSTTVAIRLFGHGAHGPVPQASIVPVVGGGRSGRLP